MTGNLGHSETDPIEGFPPFVRTVPGDQPYVRWWLPERTGEGAADYAAGVMHFAAARLLGPLVAHKFGHPDNRSMVVNIIVEMVTGGMIGPMESGFLDALAQKSLVGKIPEPMPDDLAQNTVEQSQGTLTVEVIREGEQFGVDRLIEARASESWHPVASDLYAIIGGGLDRYRCGYVWTVCGAAMAGGAH